MQRQAILSIILVILIIGGGSAAFQVLVWTKPEPPRNDVGISPLYVEGERLAPRTIVEPIVGYGAVRAQRRAWISAQVVGEVSERAEALRVGRAVAPSMTLLRIDDREYQQQLRRARSLLAADEAELERLEVEGRNLERLIEIADAEIAIAEREYKRVLDLFESEQAPRRELDVAKQAYESARRTLQNLKNEQVLLPKRVAVQQAGRERYAAEVALAELNVERCRIAAPFSGRIETVAVERGERVASGQRLFALLDPRRIEVPIELPVSQRQRVAVGAPCELLIESDTDTRWRGAIARIAPSANEANRTFSIFVEVDNTQQPQPLLPGAFVRARIDGPTLDGVLVIPRGSISEGRVFLFEEGAARPRRVEVVRRLVDEAVITGLSPGDTVITSNLDSLFDGRPVMLQTDRRATGQTDGAGRGLSDEAAAQEAEAGPKTAKGS